jgi:glycosyltransferase involved in cell wall biosynthesis
MYLDLDSVLLSETPQTAAAPTPDWTVLVPFFNERDYLAATIASLAAQSVPFVLVLIDNGSTDDSAQVARAACHDLGIDYLLVIERAAGKVAALRAGMRRVRTRYVATCDADTLYPPHYLAAAGALLAEPACVVTGAYFVAPGADGEQCRKKARTILGAARVLPRQSHTGGAGQAFHSETLRLAGGFDARRWNYVLEDHEIIHRMMRYGAMRYSTDLWCAPSPRERDRESIRWTLVERLLYSVAAPWAGDWFFYRFLARRLARRRLLSHCIRERAFNPLERPVFVPSHSVL